MTEMKLTKEEREIEDSAEQFQSAPAKTRQRVERIVERSKKNKAISLRMSSFDLDRIKRKAAQQGMPYQTLINVILHKYVTNQVFDKEEVIKTLQAAKESKAI